MEILWDYRVVLDLFLGGVGIGAFLFGAILFYLDSTNYESIIKKSWIISPALIILGLILLLSELGRPINLITAIFNANSTSVMSIGMFLQGICVLLMVLVLFGLLKSKVKDMSKVLVYLTTAFTGLVGIYHGFLLTGIERIAWTDAIPSMFLISSILAGISLTLLICAKDKAFKDVLSELKIPLIFNILLTFQFISIFSWLYSLAIRGADTKAVYNELLSSFGTQFFLFIVIGLIIPIFIFTLMSMKKIETKGMLATASVCIIFGSLTIKYIVIYLGQMV